MDTIGVTPVAGGVSHTARTSFRTTPTARGIMHTRHAYTGTSASASTLHMGQVLCSRCHVSAHAVHAHRCTVPLRRNPIVFLFRKHTMHGSSSPATEAPESAATCSVRKSILAEMNMQLCSGTTTTQSAQQPREHTGNGDVFKIHIIAGALQHQCSAGSQLHSPA